MSGMNEHPSKFGFRELSTRPVGLVTWRLSLLCRVIESKSLPTVEEFILRSVDAGLGLPSQVGQFLNLPEQALIGVMTSLYQRGLLQRADAGAETGAVMLSGEGEAILEDLVEIIPKDEVLKFNLDALTGEVTAGKPVTLIAAREVDPLAAVLFPSRIETARERSEGDDAIFRAAFARENDVRGQVDLVAVIGLAEQPEKRFVAAVGRLLESKDEAAELYLAIEIDGRRSEIHELEFLSSGLLEELRISGRVREDRVRIDRTLVRALVAARVSDDRVDALVDAIGDSDSEYDDQKDDAVASKTASLIGRTSSRAIQLRQAHAELETIPVRRLHARERGAILADWLAAARDVVNMTVPNTRDFALDMSVVSLVESLLEQKVSVTLWIDVVGNDKTMLMRKNNTRLFDLAKRARNPMAIQWRVPGYAHFLVVDSSRALVGATSFLGPVLGRFGDDRPTQVLGEDLVKELEMHLLTSLID